MTNFWIQYHNFDALEYLPGDYSIDEDKSLASVSTKDYKPSCISSKKKEILEAKGDAIFLIVGRTERGSKNYYLWSRAIFDTLDSEEEGTYHMDVTQGWVLTTLPLLNSPEFREFMSRCGGFAFGLMKINHLPYLETLKDLSEKFKPVQNDCA